MSQFSGEVSYNSCHQGFSSFVICVASTVLISPLYKNTENEIILCFIANIKIYVKLKETRVYYCISLSKYSLTDTNLPTILTYHYLQYQRFIFIQYFKISLRIVIHFCSWKLSLLFVKSVNAIKWNPYVKPRKSI